jgi:sugar lactone lactonase YvrE
VSYEQATLKGTINPEGSATNYYFEYGKTESYGTKIPVSPESVGSGTSNVAVSQTPTGLSQSTTYHFRVVAEGETTTKGEDLTFTTAGFNFEFGEEGSGNGQFKQPNLGIATDAEGNIWVADTENNRVQKFNSKGEYLAQFGKEGTGNGEFKAPKGLAIGPSGNIWVVDSGNNRVQKFNSKGEYLLKFGEKGSGEGQFNSPAGITFSGTNGFVVDSGNNRVQKFNLNSTPKFLAQFGKEGSGDGEFKSPTGVVVESSHILVTDTGNNRVQKFNATTFNYVSEFGEKGSGEGQFESPTGIVSDFQGRLWVVDSGNDRAQKFNLDGEYQDQFGEEGTGIGQLSNPTGITTPAAQKALILDTGNDRVEGWTVKAEPPDVIARPAEDLKASSATLRANIDPEALATSYWFEYGTTTAYGTKVPITPEAIGSGSSAVKVSQPVTGLSKNTEYHFRAVAESVAGTVQGEDKTFELVAPRAITEAATAVKATQATLNGKVDPEGSATSYWFEYGTTTSYGTKIPVTPISVGSGTVGVAVSQTPTGLSEVTTYHFRLVAESEVDTAYGVDKTFTTLKSPKATTEAATSVERTQATLNAKVNPEGLATAYWFEYGKTEAYGAKIPVSPASVGSGTEDVAVSQIPTGLGEGTTYHYRAVAESAGGTVFGSDKTLKTLGPPKAITEAATAIKSTQATLNAKVNPEGLATSYYFEYGPTTSYGTKIPLSPVSVGSGTANVEVSQTPIGLSQVTTYHFRVVAENEAGVAKGADKTLTTGPSFSFAFGSEGSGNGQFLYPGGVATDPEGNVWVADSSGNRIQTFDPKGQFLGKFGSEGSGNGQFLFPFGIAVDSEGNVWVADTGNHRVQEFNSEGEFIRTVGSEGSGNGQFFYPHGIATDPEGNVWVTDTYNHRVQKFDSEGEYLAQFGSEGTGNGQFLFPFGIAVDPEGNVWVADTENHRLQKFDSEGEYLAQFGSEGSGNGQFLYPYGIATDPEGAVWVADSGNSRIQAFDSEGEYLFKFGSEGSGSGQFWEPLGIATDAGGNVWVADTANNRIQKWIR